MRNSDKISEALAADERWRDELDIAVRGDKLYWLMVLAEMGLEAKRKQFKEEKVDLATGAASLASWEMDMQKITEAIVTSVKKKGRKK